jgi:hypothetical protein
VIGIGVLVPAAYILVLVAMTISPVSYVAPAREESILIGTLMGTNLLSEGQSERSFRMLHRPLSGPERGDLYEVFRRVGEGLAILELPGTYDDWTDDRRRHLERDLAYSEFNAAHYEQYRRHLGPWRHATLLRVQSILVPYLVRRMLGLEPCRWLPPSLTAYRAMVRIGLRPLIHRLVMPRAILTRIRRLDHAG